MCETGPQFLKAISTVHFRYLVQTKFWAQYGHKFRHVDQEITLREQQATERTILSMSRHRVECLVNIHVLTAVIFGIE